MFYLRAWSNTQPCLIVEGGGIICEMEIFSPTFKMGRSKQNDIVELWKFSLKMVGC